MCTAPASLRPARQQHDTAAAAEPGSSTVAAGEQNSSIANSVGSTVIPSPVAPAEKTADVPDSGLSRTPVPQAQGEPSAAMRPAVDPNSAATEHLFHARGDAAAPQESALLQNQDPTHRSEATSSPRGPIKPISRAPALPGADPVLQHSLSQPAGQDFVREPSGVSAPRSIQPPPMSAQAAGQDTFAALDKAASPAVAWIHAGAHHAEAGYLDPSLGWVSVRADAGAAGLHASIIPGSSLAASTLGDHLAGLNAFLAEHNHAATVTLAPEAPTSGELPPGSEQHSQGNHQQPDQNPEAGASGPPAANGTIAAQPAAIHVAAAPPAGNGVYLSVLA